MQRDLRLPRELGGPGGGTNPEQLFAAGYAACFHGALALLAARAGLCIAEAEVRARVTFGRDPVDGLYALAAHIDIHLPGVDRAVAEALVRNVERHCPYAKMARQGIESVVAPTQQVRRLMSAPAAGCPGSAGPARGCARSCSR